MNRERKTKTRLDQTPMAHAGHERKNPESNIGLIISHESQELK